MKSTLSYRNWITSLRLPAMTGVLAYALVFLLSLSGTPLAQAQNYSVVYSFQCGPDQGGPGDGQNPWGDLIADSAGNLYGTTYGGGNYGAGTVFEVSAAGTETVLHSFAGFPDDGSGPVAGLVRDSAGNLYGTTLGGGTIDVGTVFEVSASGMETVLHSFTNGKDEADPAGRLLLDASGNLYGTTESYPTADEGTVFKLAPSGKITELHSFPAFIGDGEIPVAGLIRDSAGNLYGTTGGGGANGNFGTVFELSKDETETVLYSFGSGAAPVASLVRDSHGNLYSTTQGGGEDTGLCQDGENFEGCGTVFKLAPDGQETVLYAFKGGADGGTPMSDLVLEQKGNLYGTAAAGGDLSCQGNFGVLGCGVVFGLTVAGKEKVLHAFTGFPDGEAPYSGLLHVGNYLYGTTYYGGTYGCGTVYKITP